LSDGGGEGAFSSETENAEDERTAQDATELRDMIDYVGGGSAQGSEVENVEDGRAER
jgi:hypothetical protein